MNMNLTIRTSIDIGADSPKVWDALTNPEKIKIYLFGTNTLTDWKIGSEIIFEGEYQGQRYRDKGVIIDIKANELLRYSYWSAFAGLEDKPENYSIVTYEIRAAGTNTALTITQAGFANEQAQQHSKSAWENILNQIKMIAEMNDGIEF
jgi:uncharacterized protein YndB with AHSA1/START domain